MYEAMLTNRGTDRQTDACLLPYTVVYPQPNFVCGVKNRILMSLWLKKNISYQYITYHVKYYHFTMRNYKIYI